jgi:hypothetical protein
VTAPAAVKAAAPELKERMQGDGRKMKGFSYVYILESETYPARLYVGLTDDLRIDFGGITLAMSHKANLSAANSRITDVDVAEESTQLARYNILVQAGTSMLSQANQSAQAALKLIG